MTNTIQDYVNDSEWWRKMHIRYGYQNDPANPRYGFFHNSGLRHPIAIDSNPQYAVHLKAHQQAPTGPYSMGGVSKLAAHHIKPIQTCTDASGRPHGCATVVLGLQATNFEGSHQFKNLG